MCLSAVRLTLSASSIFCLSPECQFYRASPSPTRDSRHSRLRNPTADSSTRAAHIYVISNFLACVRYTALRKNDSRHTVYKPVLYPSGSSALTADSFHHTSAVYDTPARPAPTGAELAGSGGQGVYSGRVFAFVHLKRAAYHPAAARSQAACLV